MDILKLPKKLAAAGPVVLSEWLVMKHQSVTKGQTLAQLETTTAVVELQAPATGTVLEMLVNAGCAVPSDGRLAVLGDPADTDAAAPTTHPEPDLEPRASSPVATEPMTSSQAGPSPDDPPPNDAATADAAAQAIPILMPQAGQSMEEGTIVTWLVKAGDTITKGQPIAEIETDKAVMEIEAEHGGRLAKILAHEGEVVEVTTPIALLADDDAAADRFLASQDTAGSQPSSTPPAAPLSQAQAASPALLSGDRVKASPAARKLARQRGIPLHQLAPGSGPGGRVLSSDVMKEQATGTASGTVTHPLTKTRMAIARNLSWSKQNIPHFCVSRVVEAERLFTLFQETKQRFVCTVNDFVIRACALAIREHALFRSQLQEEHILEHGSVNIGVAVGTDEGLLVPVVLDADHGTLQELAVKTRTVVEYARNGKLTGVGHGVFSISNLGMFGVEEFTAIINPPESAILAVGALREDVVVKDRAIIPTRVMTMTVCVDHRLIDGVAAAQFLNRVKELLEAPEHLL